MLLLEYVCHVYSIAHSLSVCLSVRMLVYCFFFFHLSAFVANKRMYKLHTNMDTSNIMVNNFTTENNKFQEDHGISPSLKCNLIDDWLS